MPNTIDLIAGLIFGLVGCFLAGYGAFLGMKPLLGGRDNLRYARAFVIIVIGFGMVAYTVFAVVQTFP